MAFTAEQKKEIDNIVKQSVTLQEMQHQEDIAQLRAEYEYDGRLARKTRIDQEVTKYKSPADKRAIKFLFDAKFDSADFEKKARVLLNEEGKLPEDIPKEKLVTFVQEALSYIVKSKRKNEREIEAYEIANSCQEGYGWSTVKHYFEEEIFSKTDEFAKPWYEKPEQTEAEKANKLRKARKLAKASREKEKDFSYPYPSAKRSRFGAPSSSYSGYGLPPATAVSGGDQNQFQHFQQPAMYSQALVNPVPSASFYPSLSNRLANVQCFNCLSYGHMKQNCPLLTKATAPGSSVPK